MDKQPKYLNYKDARLIYAIFFKENFSDDAEDLSGPQKLSLVDPILYKRMGISLTLFSLSF